MTAQKSVFMMLQYIFPFLILLGLGACDPLHSPVPGSESGEIYPVATGNRWEHVGFVYDTTGFLIDSNGVSITEISDDTVMYGKRFFLEGHLWRASTDSGSIYIHRDALRNLGPDFIFEFKYPVLFNDLYQSDTYDVLITSTDTLIQVPAGEFRCVKYEFSRGLKIWDYYISPGTGVVKEVIYYANRHSGDPEAIQHVSLLKGYRLY